MDSPKNWLFSLLRWSERYTKTDMVYLTSGGFWLLFERAAVVLVGLLMAVVFANFLAPESYGVYKYVLSMMGIAGAFSLAGLSTAVSQAAARGYEGALVSGFKTSLRWSIGTVFIAFGIALYYFLNGNSVLGISFLIGGSFAPLITSAGLYDGFLSGSQRFSAKALYGILRNGLPPLILIGAVFVSKNPAILITVYFVSTAAITLWCYADALHRYAPNNQMDSATARFGKHLSIINLLGVVSSQADRVLIFTMFGGTALAIYSFAEAVPDQIRSLNSILATLSLPKASKLPLAELKRILPQKALLLFMVALSMVAVYVLAAPTFFSLFFPKYLEAVPYSQVYALVVLSLPSSLYSSALTAHMRNRELYTQRFVTAGSKIGLLLLLIPQFQIWGAVFAMVGSYAIAGLFYLWQFGRLKAS